MKTMIQILDQLTVEQVA